MPLCAVIVPGGKISKVERRRWPRLLSALYRLYFRTLNIRVLLPEGSSISLSQYVFEPVVFAHSERQALALAGVLPHIRFTLLIAEGKDGDWAAEAIECAGCSVVRGSSLRSGSKALLRLVRSLRDSPAPAAICIDGPVGPQGQAKGGALLCAQRLQRPVLPLGAAAKAKITFRRTWSQIFLPLPFTQVVFVVGEPLWVPKDASRGKISELAIELNRRLELADRRAAEAVFENLRLDRAVSR